MAAAELAVPKPTTTMMPIIGKVYCSPHEVVLVVRRRPNVANGGGFVVADCGQKVVFRVDGCGILGKKEEMLLRDGDGNDLLLIRRKGAIMEALRMGRQWKGYTQDFLGSQKLVFTLKESNSSPCSCFPNSTIPIRISIQPTELVMISFSTNRYFHVRGDFSARSCTIIDSTDNVVVAQVGLKKEMEQVILPNKDFYHVRIRPGVDQAFVFGVIAVLDYIYDESATRCS